MTFSPQGRPGVNGYKGEKGEAGVGSSYGYPVSIYITTSALCDLSVAGLSEILSCRLLQVTRHELHALIEKEILHWSIKKWLASNLILMNPHLIKKLRSFLTAFQVTN